MKVNVLSPNKKSTYTYSKKHINSKIINKFRKRNLIELNFPNTKPLLKQEVKMWVDFIVIGKNEKIIIDAINTEVTHAMFACSLLAILKGLPAFTKLFSVLINSKFTMIYYYIARLDMLHKFGTPNIIYNKLVFKTEPSYIKRYIKFAIEEPEIKDIIGYTIKVLRRERQIPFSSIYYLSNDLKIDYEILAFFICLPTISHDFDSIGHIAKNIALLCGDMDTYTKYMYSMSTGYILDDKLKSTNVPISESTAETWHDENKDMTELYKILFKNKLYPIIESQGTKIIISHAYKHVKLYGEFMDALLSRIKKMGISNLYDYLHGNNETYENFNEQNRRIQNNLISYVNISRKYDQIVNDFYDIKNAKFDFISHGITNSWMI